MVLIFTPPHLLWQHTTLVIFMLLLGLCLFVSHYSICLKLWEEQSLAAKFIWVNVLIWNCSDSTLFFYLFYTACKIFQGMTLFFQQHLSPFPSFSFCFSHTGQVCLQPLIISSFSTLSHSLQHWLDFHARAFEAYSSIFCTQFLLFFLYCNFVLLFKSPGSRFIWLLSLSLWT